MTTTLPLVILRVGGNDAETFLQGQLTNDISKVRTDSAPHGTHNENTDSSSQRSARWQWAALCNPKGRAIATMLCWHDSDQETFYLLLQQDIASRVITHLRRFIFRSKVTITATQPTSVTLADISERPDENSQNIIVTKADDHSSIIQLLLTDATALHINLGQTAPSEQNDADSDWLETSVPDHQQQALAQLITEYHLPFIGHDLSEQIIPNHMDFDALGGTDYKKGCYTGQEVIARLHYLGKSKEALYALESEAPLQTSQALYAPETSGDQPIGLIISAYETNNRHYGLATIKTKAADSLITTIPKKDMENPVSKASTIKATALF